MNILVDRVIIMIAEWSALWLRPWRYCITIHIIKGFSILGAEERQSTRRMSPGMHWPVSIYSKWPILTPIPDDQRMERAGRGSWGEPEATFRIGPGAHQSAQSTRSQVPARSVHVRGSSQRSTRHSVDSVRRQPSRRLRATSCSKSARKATRTISKPSKY